MAAARSYSRVLFNKQEESQNRPRHDRAAASFHDHRDKDYDDDDSQSNSTCDSSSSTVTSSRTRQMRLTLAQEDELRYLNYKLHLLQPRIDTLHESNAFLTASLQRAEDETERVKVLLDEERQWRNLVSQRSNQREATERRALEVALERATGERRDTEDVVRMKDGEIQILERRIGEGDLKTGKLLECLEREKSIAEALRTELARAEGIISTLEAKAQEMSVRDKESEGEKHKLREATEVQRTKKVEVLRQLKAFHDHCVQELFDIPERTINTSVLASLIEQELSLRPLADFGYDIRKRSTRRQFIEMLVGILKLEAFKVGCLSDLEVDVIPCASVVVAASNKSKNRPNIESKVDVLVAFKREGVIVSVTFIDVACVTAGCWFEKFFSPTSPQNRAPFEQLPPQHYLWAEGKIPPYRQTLSMIRHEGVRDAFRDLFKTVSLERGAKEARSFVTVNDLLRMKMNKLRACQLPEERADIVRQRIALAQIVTACVWESEVVSPSDA